MEVEWRRFLWSRDGSRWCLDGDIGDLIEDGRILVADHLLVDDDVLPLLVVDDWRGGGRRVDSEARTKDDFVSKFIEGDALVWIGLEDSTQDGVEFV